MDRFEKQRPFIANLKRNGQLFFFSIFVLFFFLLPQISLAQIDNNFFNGGGIRVGDSTTACAGNGGGIRFDANSSDGGGLQYCDGTNWLVILTNSFSGVVNNGNSFAAPMTIGTNDNNTLAFETNNSVAMTIDTSGNVGVGTTAPTDRLHVVGDLRIDRGTTTTALDRTLTIIGARANSPSDFGSILFRNYDSDNTSEYNAAEISSSNTGTSANNGDLRFSTRDGGLSEKMIITGLGNVGIGTTAPGAELDVTGTGAIIVPEGTVAQRPGTPQNGMIRYNSDNNKMEAYENGGWADLISAGGGGDFLADGSVAMTGGLELPDGTAASPSLFFTNSTNTGLFYSGGNVIRYSVAGNERFNMNNDRFFAVGGGALSRLNTVADPALSFNGDTNTGLFNPAADEIAFSNAGNESVRIDASGNFGIGTATPLAKMTIIQETDSSDATNADQYGLLIGNPANDNGEEIGIAFRISAGLNAQPGGAITFERHPTIMGGTGSLLFKTRGVGSYTRMKIDENGYVGIGTTTPNVALDVNGSIEYTGTITDVSDRRLKEDIRPIDNALETITSVDGVSFIMKGDEKRRIEFGVIAQDLEEVLPELVHTADDEMKSKSVNYVGFIGWIIEAIKDLAFKDSEKDKRILELESKLDQQVKENDRQNREIESLKALVKEKLK